MKMLRADCPTCGRDCAAYVPSGGDGSAYRVRAHRREFAPRTEPCSGSYRLITEVRDPEEESQPIDLTPRN